ncbi:hypothetical protein [Paenibacillus sp. FSL W7-1332]|uniref:hypothetical protein n=1 Tax=Paenibacillus sp. FSL W7-1332 TaxID=2921702 RepID=UPI0030CD3E3C
MKQATYEMLLEPSSIIKESLFGDQSISSAASPRDRSSRSLKDEKTAADSISFIALNPGIRIPEVFLLYGFPYLMTAVYPS